MDGFDSFYRMAVVSMESAFAAKQYRLAAIYCQLANQYLWLFDELSFKEGDKSEKND